MEGLDSSIKQNYLSGHCLIECGRKWQISLADLKPPREELVKLEIELSIKPKHKVNNLRNVW